MAIPDMSGVSPLAAIRQFSDPEAWAKFEQLLGLEVVTAEERASWNADDWARRDYQMALMLQSARLRPAEHVTALHSWAQLRNAFKARLQSGELVATGYVKPVELTDRPTAIPTDKWRFLKLDYLNGSASGEGLEIVSILIYRAEPQEISGPDDVAALLYRTGLPGKPSIKHLIVQEFRCRGESGDYELTLKAEAQALHEWAKDKHPKAPTPTPKTIENHIRDDYHRLIRNKPTK